MSSTIAPKTTTIKGMDEADCGWALDERTRVSFEVTGENREYETDVPYGMSFRNLEYQLRLCIMDGCVGNCTAGGHDNLMLQ